MVIVKLSKFCDKSYGTGTVNEINFISTSSGMENQKNVINYYLLHAQTNTTTLKFDKVNSSTVIISDAIDMIFLETRISSFKIT